MAKAQHYHEADGHLLCPACAGGQGKGKTSPRKAEASRQNAEKARATWAEKRKPP